MKCELSSHIIYVVGLFDIRFTVLFANEICFVSDAPKNDRSKILLSPLKSIKWI